MTTQNWGREPKSAPKTNQGPWAARNLPRNGRVGKGHGFKGAFLAAIGDAIASLLRSHFPPTDFFGFRY